MLRRLLDAYTRYVPRVHARDDATNPRRLTRQSVFAVHRCTHTPRMSAMSQLAVGGRFEKHDGQDTIKLFNYNTVQSTPRPAQ